MGLRHWLELLELLSHYGYFESYPDFEKLAKEKFHRLLQYQNQHREI